MNDALDKALVQWVSRTQGVELSSVADAELEFDAGWGGTDVTPGDPAEITVHWREVVYTPHAVVIPFKDVPGLIRALAELAAKR